MKAIKDEGLVPVIEEAASDTVAEGKVIETDPSGGTDVDPDSEVTLTISTGKPDLPVPSVVTLTRDEAEAKLVDQASR